MPGVVFAGAYNRKRGAPSDKLQDRKLCDGRSVCEAEAALKETNATLKDGFQMRNPGTRDGLVRGCVAELDSLPI